MNTSMTFELHASTLQAIALIGAIIAMLYGLNIVYKRLKAKGQGFGSNSLKALGVVIFVPMLAILATTSNFQNETLAALLGTVAGYVLSSSKPDE